MGKYYRSSAVVRWLSESLCDCAIKLMPYGMSDADDDSLRYKAAKFLMRKTGEWAQRLTKI